MRTSMSEDNDADDFLLEQTPQGWKWTLQDEGLVPMQWEAPPNPVGVVALHNSLIDAQHYWDMQDDDDGDGEQQQQVWRLENGHVLHALEWLHKADIQELQGRLEPQIRSAQSELEAQANRVDAHKSLAGRLENDWKELQNQYGLQSLEDTNKNWREILKEKIDQQAVDCREKFRSLVVEQHNDCLDRIGKYYYSTWQKLGGDDDLGKSVVEQAKDGFASSSDTALLIRDVYQELKTWQGFLQVRHRMTLTSPSSVLLPTLEEENSVEENEDEKLVVRDYEKQLQRVLEDFELLLKRENCGWFMASQQQRDAWCRRLETAESRMKGAQEQVTQSESELQQKENRLQQLKATYRQSLIRVQNLKSKLEKEIGGLLDEDSIEIVLSAHPYSQ